MIDPQNGWVAHATAGIQIAMPPAVPDRWRKRDRTREFPEIIAHQKAAITHIILTFISSRLWCLLVF